MAYRQDKTKIQRQHTVSKAVSSKYLQSRPFASKSVEAQKSEITELPPMLNNGGSYISRLATVDSASLMSAHDLQQTFVIQRDSHIPIGSVSPEFEGSLNRARGGGSPLEPKIQTQMESAMGADFSRVKVHTDAQADHLSQSIQAKAFTTGNDVFFKQGAYAPRSPNGQELLAHELTHVMQQGGSSIRRKDEITNNSELSHVDNIIDSFPLESIQDDDESPDTSVTEKTETDETETTDNIIESMQVDNDEENITFSNQPKQEEKASSLLQSPEQTQDQKTELPQEVTDEEEVDNNSNLQTSSQQVDQSPKNISDISTIKDSLKAVEDAYTSAADNVESIERLKYAFEEDKQIVEPYKGYSSDDTKQELERVKKKKEQVELKVFSIKNLKTRSKRSDEEANKYDEELYEYKQQIEYLQRALDTEDFEWDEDWKVAEERVSDATVFYKNSIKDKATIADNFTIVTRLREKYSAKSKDLTYSQQNGKQIARLDAQEKAKDSTQRATKIQESLDTLKKHKTDLVEKDRMAPGFVSSLLCQDKSNLWKYTKVKVYPKIKEKTHDFFRGMKSGGYKKAVGSKDKRGFIKPARRTNIKKEAKEAKKNIEREYKILQSLDLRSNVQRLFDCQILAFQTADQVVLDNLSRVLTFVKAYILILQLIFPPFASILEIFNSAINIIQIGIKLLQVAINVIISLIRGVQEKTSSPFVRNILKTSYRNSAVKSFSSAAGLVATCLEQWNANGGQKPDFSLENLDNTRFDELSQNEKANYLGAKPGTLGTTILTNELLEETEGFKNSNSSIKGDLGQGKQIKNNKNDRQNQDTKVSDNEILISEAIKALNKVTGKLNLFGDGSKKMDDGLKLGTTKVDEAMDKSQQDIQKDEVSKEDADTLKDTEDANSSMKISKEIFELIDAMTF
ncbi:MAG: DUF4157 domain-containing protein [Cyanobacteria bacterium P01_D01_bin.156]